MPFQQIDHTGDVGIEVSATSLEELFCEATRGLTDIITDLSSVEVKDERMIEVDGTDREQLLQRFLSELLFLFDTERFLCSECAIGSLTDTNITAVLKGEAFDPERHEGKTEVKAVTYHGMEIKEDNGTFRCTIILDI